jgi:hypothetical protein
MLNGQTPSIDTSLPARKPDITQPMTMPAHTSPGNDMIATYLNTSVHKHRTTRQITVHAKPTSPQSRRVYHRTYPYMNRSTLTPNQPPERGYINVRHNYTSQPDGQACPRERHEPLSDSCEPTSTLPIPPGEPVFRQ